MHEFGLTHFKIDVPTHWYIWCTAVDIIAQTSKLSCKIFCFYQLQHKFTWDSQQHEHLSYDDIRQPLEMVRQRHHILTDHVGYQCSFKHHCCCKHISKVFTHQNVKKTSFCQKPWTKLFWPPSQKLIAVTEPHTDTHLSLNKNQHGVATTLQSKVQGMRGGCYTCTRVAHTLVTQISQSMQGSLLYLAAWAKAVSSYGCSRWGWSSWNAHILQHTAACTKLALLWQKQSYVIIEVGERGLHIQPKLKQAVFLGVCFLCMLPEQGWQLGDQEDEPVWV